MILLKYTKLGNAKFLGHLDVQRIIRRAFAKANIEVEKSQGFNPHTLFYFAQPLGLGIESECELVVAHAQYSENILSNLKACQGINFLRCVEIQKEISLAADVVFSKYVIKIDNFKNHIEKFMELLNGKELFLEVKSKSFKHNIDVKSLIKEYSVNDDGIECTVACGNPNLRPDVLVNGIFSILQINEHFDCIKKEVYFKDGFSSENIFIVKS